MSAYKKYVCDGCEKVFGSESSMPVCPACENGNLHEIDNDVANIIISMKSIIENRDEEITRLRSIVSELREDAKFWYGECQGVIPDEEIELHRSLMSKVDEVMG